MTTKFQQMYWKQCKMKSCPQKRDDIVTLTLHDEKNTGCCSLVSKAGMTIEVRAASKRGSLSKYLSKILSNPFALYLGPLSAVKFIRVWLNGPL
jgi:hypothetical protein